MNCLYRCWLRTAATAGRLTITYCYHTVEYYRDMKHSCWLLFILLSSCAIRINDNGYRSLKAKDKMQLQRYKPGMAPNSGYYEITGAEIKQAMAAAPYTWVHLWRPYCPGPQCYPPIYYARIAQQHEQVQFFLLSENYDPWHIARQMQHGAINHPIYFVMDSVYGHNADRNRKRIIAEMMGAGHGRGSSHIIFKGDKPVYMGYDMSNAIMDSVLRVAE
jgi:hypothetical protein